MGLSQELTALLLALGGLSAAVLSIWALLDRVSKKFSNIVDTKINATLEKNNKIQEKQIQMLFEAAEKAQEIKFKSISEEIAQFKEEQHLFNTGQDALTRSQTEAILETFAQDIRDIHDNLRRTGIISEADKAYVDRIYPHYIILGGKNGIHTMVKEIQDVYTRRAQEAYDDKAKQSKVKKSAKTLIEESTTI